MAASKLKVSRLIEPYDSKGHSNLIFANKRSGVYLIYKDGVLVYVGFSGVNLYKTCTRHFQEWSSKWQRVTTYVNSLKYCKFQVRVILCSPARAARLEKALIIKWKPKDNPDKLKGYTLNESEEEIYTDFKETPCTNYDDLPF